MNYSSTLFHFLIVLPNWYRKDARRIKGGLFSKFKPELQVNKLIIKSQNKSKIIKMPIIIIIKHSHLSWSHKAFQCGQDEELFVINFNLRKPANREKKPWVN